MSGKSSNILSVAVATSVNGGGDQDTNFLPQPDLGGLTYVGMSVGEGAVGAFASDELFHEENHGRRTPGQDMPVAIGVRNTTGSTKFGAPDGEFIRVMYPDSIEVQHRFRTPGGADPELYGFGKILGSSFAIYKPSAASVISPAAGSADGTTLQIAAADLAKLTVGAPIRRRIANTQLDEYAIVTRIAAENAGEHTVTVHPRFSSQVALSQVITLCYGFFPVVGLADSRLLKDFHLRLDVGGVGSDATVRRTASLCRCSGFSIGQDNYGTSLTMRARPACMYPDSAANASTITTSEPPGDLLQHRFGCRVDLGAAHTGSAAPLSQARATLANFDWSVDVSADVSPSSPDTRGILQANSMEINNSTCEVTITSENSEELQRMIAKGERRTLILGMGPSSTDNSQGGAFIVMNAARADGSANPVGGDNNRLQQETKLRAVADSTHCDTSGLDAAGLRLASAPFMLVLPRKD
jgi:hypothetical protein